VKTLIDEQRLQARITEMAREIDEHYEQQEWYRKTQEPVVIVGVLTGAVFFMADLVRQLSIRVELDFMRVSTYPGKATVAQTPKIITPPDRLLEDAHVLILDDILDTGKTLKIVEEYIATHVPRSMRTCVLLRKPGKAVGNVGADFVGFDIPDEFIVGYGLDYNCRYREKPYVAIWSEEDEQSTSKSEFGRDQAFHCD